MHTTLQGSHHLLIDGTLVETARKADVVDPATEEAFAHAGIAEEVDLNNAVQAAQRAYSIWSASSWDRRSQLLLAYADGIEAGTEELARILVLEQGKPLASAKGEIASGLKFLRAFATMRLEDHVVSNIPGRQVRIKRTPLGVVGAITPWNYPVLIPMWKLGPALIAGNTVVLKPAPTTPLTS
jgi:acyl-CoA reductase-like NAD-dependent aldehyde dehydrogenase